MNEQTDHEKALSRLRYLVGVMCEPMETTRGGIVKPKTAKQRSTEAAVANEVVRFAFDHAGITEGFLAPGGLFIQLQEECGGYRHAPID